MCAAFHHKGSVLLFPLQALDDPVHGFCCFAKFLFSPASEKKKNAAPLKYLSAEQKMFLSSPRTCCHGMPWKKHLLVMVFFFFFLSIFTCLSVPFSRPAPPTDLYRLAGPEL